MHSLVATGQFSLVTVAEQVPSELLRMLGRPVQGYAHVPFAAGTAAERNLLGARIDAAVMQADRAVLLVAQGAACFAAAWWARLSPSSYVSRVAGALLVAPMEEERARAEAMRDSFASPRTALPFPSILIENAVPQLDVAAQVRALALGWGSQVVDEQVDAGSPMRRTRRAIERFTAAVVESKVRAAESLISLRR